MNKKILFLAYLLIIALLVVLPVNDRNSKINHTYLFTIRLDYILHALLFCPWMFFYHRIRALWWANRITKAGWLFGGLLFGCLSELLQYVTPYRTLNVKDLLANCTGILAGAVIFFLLELKNAGRKRADH